MGEAKDLPGGKKAMGQAWAREKKALLEAARGDVGELEERLTRGALGAVGIGAKVLAHLRAAAGL